MDKRTLELLHDRLIVRVIMTKKGRLYARLALYESDATALDKIAQFVDHPRVAVSRTGAGYLALLIQAQSGVAKFCEVTLPHLQEGDPLRAELVLAKAVAEAPWYDRYEILLKFLEEE